MAKKFYAFIIEDKNIKQIVTTWEECKKYTNGVKGVRYKSFKTKKEAIDWLDNGGLYEKKQVKKLKIVDILDDNAIYFDAGTGRGIGVEVRVTNSYGKSLLSSILPNSKINNFGNFLAPKNSTNNFGELLGLYLALNISILTNNLKIFGDSKLVIDYWSKGRYNKEKLSNETIFLIEKVIKKSLEFEKLGGMIKYISGDINPADLGFHR